MSATASTASWQLEQTPVVQRLQETSFNREAAYHGHRDALSDHHVVQAEVLDETEQRLVEEPTDQLLTELRSFGLLWSAVAQAIGVSDAAIRKWRKGGAIEETRKRRLARLVALARLHRRYRLPSTSTGFAEWLDTRIMPEFSATPLDLLTLNRESDSVALQPLLDWMFEHADREHGAALLDRYFGESWRQQAQDEQRFRIVRSAQGDRVLIIDE
jgi:hypothetical protein